MPISDCEVRDPRIRRTRQLLRSSLSTLLRSRPFGEISVQDITEEATVNRATFYDHYADKFALLDALIAGGFHKIVHERQVAFDGSCPTAAATIIGATCDYLQQIHEEAPEHAGPCSFQALLDSAMTAAIGRVLLAGMKTYPAEPIVSPEMRAAAASWAIYGAAKEWFSMVDRPASEAIVPEILALVLPILRVPDELTMNARDSRSGVHVA
jgi:AcrR family transcriptional regulator